MASRQLDEEAIFHFARKLENPADRGEYLEQICAGDMGLKSRVEELLKVNDEEQRFLKSSPDPGTTADLPPLSERPGQEIGRYKLLAKLGEGGMGTVFMAEQLRPVKRRVAVKIISVLPASLQNLVGRWGRRVGRARTPLMRKRGSRGGWRWPGGGQGGRTGQSWETRREKAVRLLSPRESAVA
jgi:hypothetical protein